MMGATFTPDEADQIFEELSIRANRAGYVWSPRVLFSDGHRFNQITSLMHFLPEGERQALARQFLIELGAPSRG